jgi:heme/copper-type cytochrome/quinol oxidase subunit 2
MALVVGSLSISQKQLKWIFLSLSIGIWIATLSAYYNYFQMGPGLQDQREMVQGISHIRLSLLVVLQVGAVVYFWPALNTPLRFYCGLVILNGLFFLNLLQSSTGAVVLAVLLVFSLLYFSAKIKSAKTTLFITLLPLLLIAGLAIFSVNYYQNYFVAETESKPLETKTESGSRYLHTPSQIVENGHYTFQYLAYNEMREAWNNRSSHKINEGSQVEATLIRYLTSKGLRKDREGVNALSEQDVRNIEMGYPNQIYKNQQGLALRFHKLMFGWHIYSVTGKVTGLSFFQRILYWDVAAEIIDQNLWLGTGTGDVKAAFKDMHRKMNPELDKRYWSKSHNQFLTFFVSFGILGFLYFISLFAAAFRALKFNYLALAFLVIAFVSCLSEDTLETQAGVTFFSFFFALFSTFSQKRGEIGSKGVTSPAMS